MESSAVHLGERAVLDPAGLQALIDALIRSRYRVVGPTVRDNAVVYGEIAATKDLPVGWTDEHARGSYRLKKRRDDAFFGYAVGPHSWKQMLLPPLLTIFRARRVDGGFQVLPRDADVPRYAFLGVRPCELAAMAIQDRVFLGGTYTNASYKARRERAFIVAVNCSDPGANCFCASMGAGPRATAGFDLLLTEVAERKRHFFLLEAGSEAGAEIAAQLPLRPPEEDEVRAAEAVQQRAESRVERSFPTDGLKETLQHSYEHPQWDSAAERCMTCGNCPQVCPTCFCTTVEDVTSLTGEVAERHQRWDSCFTVEYSYIFGGSVRSSEAARYRQWLLHKFANWQDQFGTPGCVGCGRCITWCPAGIDITDEARAIAGVQPNGKEQAGG